MAQQVKALVVKPEGPRFDPWDHNAHGTSPKS